MKLSVEWFKSVVNEISTDSERSIIDRKALNSQIETLYTEKGDIDVSDVRVLSANLFLHMELYGELNSQLIGVAETLSDHLQHGRSLLPSSRIKEWSEAVEAAQILNQASLGKGLPNEQRFPKLVELIRHVRFLSKCGVSATIVDDYVELDEDDQREFIANLERDIHYYGGVRLACHLFGEIEYLYDNIQMRYHLCRSAPFATLTPIQAELPIGYLLNMAVKHYTRAAIVLPNPDSVLCSIMDRATALTACLGVQAQSLFEYMISDKKSLPYLIRNIAIYDATFTLFQLRPKDVPRIMRALFNWVDESECYSNIGFTPRDAAVFANEILELSLPGSQPFKFRAESLSGSGLPVPTVDALLRAFSHEGQPNEEFCLPTESSKVDFWFKPLLQDGLVFTMINQSWCSPSFYEAMCIALRKYIPPKRVTEKVGLAVEHFLSMEFKARGVEVHSGKYNVNGVDGECDAVIETDDVVVFIEMKAKPLTRASRGGSEAHILIDLAKGVLSSQLQLARHHRILIEHEDLCLKNDNGDEYHLQLKGREIERVSVTLLDYGGFQDRMFLHNLLEILISTRYAPTDSRLTKEFEKMKRICESLTEELSAVSEVTKRRSRHTFMSSWFLSLPQILIILDDVTDAQSFWSALGKTRHSTTSSLDFYTEFARLKKLVNT